MHPPGAKREEAPPVALENTSPIQQTLLGSRWGFKISPLRKKWFSYCSLPPFLPHFLFHLCTLYLDWCFLSFLLPYRHVFSKHSRRCPFPACLILCRVSPSSSGALFNLLTPPFSQTLFYPFAFSQSTSLPCNLPLSAEKGNNKSIARNVELLAFPFYLNSALITIN